MFRFVCTKVLANVAQRAQKIDDLGKRAATVFGPTLQQKRDLGSFDNKDANIQALMHEIKSHDRVIAPMCTFGYTNMALGHPVYGYYMKRDVLGTKGNLKLSQDVSRIVAELTALWVFLEWSKTGEKRPLRIVDLGPGEGTLLLAMSKLATKWPQLKNSISFDVLEYSPYRKVLQQAILCHNFDDPEANMNYYLDNCRFASRTIHGHPITWHRSFHELPFYESVFSFFIAKDYFNSEGIYKFKRINGVWNQMMVDVYKDVSGLQKLRWKMKPSTAILKNVPNHEISYVPGDDYEVLGIAMMKLMNLVHFINRCEGAILIGGRGFQAEAEDLVDRDTFCGFKNFKRVDPLEEPGEADLSASIDFGYIERTIDWESMAFRSIGQANFLANLNFEARLQYYLKSIQNPIRRATMESDAKMLMETMGEEYRYMAICNRYCKEFPYGFGF